MDTLLTLLQSSPILFLSVIAIFGLLIGSFLNVVIARLPIMVLTPPRKKNNSAAFNLFYPRSHCPRCHQLISWYQNIPVISFLCLQGKCFNCQQKISWRYPLIELLSMGLSVLVAHQFGCTLTTIAALLLTYALIALTFIDIDHFILPDEITLPWIWLGLGCNLYQLFTTPTNAIWGAIIGYLSLYIFYWIFKLITRKEGMGYGDFKLLALLGAWLGWQALPFIILFSSFFGSIIGVAILYLKGKNKNSPIPFGPFLALGGFTALLFGNQFYQWYFNFIGYYP